MSYFWEKSIGGKGSGEITQYRNQCQAWLMIMWDTASEQLWEIGQHELASVDDILQVAKFVSLCIAFPCRKNPVQVLINLKRNSNNFHPEKWKFYLNQKKHTGIVMKH